MNETLPIPRTTLTEMAAAYRQAEQDIRAAFAMLVSAEKNLQAAFNTDTCRFRIIDRNNTEDFEHPDRTMHRLKHAAWRVLVDKMGIRSAMSIKRAKELDEQLDEKPATWGQPAKDPLPEITEANILAMMETTFDQLPAMMAEAVREVYDWLRPRRGFGDAYKTNQKSAWALDRKVIKEWVVAPGYGKNPFQVSYTMRQTVTALDNVFHMLDGKGVVKSHYGPLTDAIAASPDGAGETDYFKFKACKNRNLHIEFKRADLVDRFNAVAGGMNLGGERKEAA